MLLLIIRNNTLSYAIGNIIGLAKRIFIKENPLWISEFYFKYRKPKEYSFTLLWSVFMTILGFIFVLSQEISIIPTFFLVTGILMLIQFIHYFDKIYIFPDRIEQRTFFYSHLTIFFDNVVLILRDIKTKQYADVIFHHPMHKFSNLDVGLNMPWRVPAELFKNPNIKIDDSKLHPNLFKNYCNIKEHLPQNPIVVEKTNWSKKSTLKKLKNYMLFLSVIILNPYSVIVFLSICFGISYTNPVFWITIDVSRLYSKTIYKKFVANKTKLREKYGNLIS